MEGEGLQDHCWSEGDHGGNTVGAQPLHTKERLTLDYEKHDTGTLVEEWKSFTHALVGVGEDLCGRTSGKWILNKKEKPNLVDGRDRGNSRKNKRDMEDGRSD